MRKTFLNIPLALAACLAFLIPSALAQIPLGTAFTYQGNLDASGVPANGLFDLSFSLWTDPTLGVSPFAPLAFPSTTVTDGHFSIDLDFGGAIFDGSAYWLEITVDAVTLVPRQPINPTPYAIALPVLHWDPSHTVAFPDSPNIIAGHSGNAVSGDFTNGATISGGGIIGKPNLVNTPLGTIGGGLDNIISPGAWVATVVGGEGNRANGQQCNIAGGAFNIVDGTWATIGGGLSNTVSNNYSVIVGGESNIINGLHSTIPGGFENQVDSDHSFAAGRRAQISAGHHGTFLWADSRSAPFTSFKIDEFGVRSTGGVRFVTAIDGPGTPIAGAFLLSGSGTWSALSDRNVKENVRRVDSARILDDVAALPISTWNYITQDDEFRHIGPMAQDFHAAFGVGEDNRHITTIDADGVALAAIQGLNTLVRQQRLEIDEQDARIDALRGELEQLRSMVAALGVTQREGAR